MLFFRIIIIIRGDWTRIQHSAAPKLLNVRRLCRYNYSLLCETFFLFFRSVSFTPLAYSLLCLFHCFISVCCLSPSFLHFACFFLFHVYDVMQPTIQKQSVRFSIYATRFLFFPNRFLKKGSSIHRTTTLSFICMIRYTDFQNENYRYFFSETLSVV